MVCQLTDSILNNHTRVKGLTGSVLNVYDPENDAFTEKYCEEWQMRYRG